MLYLKIINLETDEFRKTILSPESNPQRECLIGRSSTCDLVLNSPDVSRFHAKIFLQSESYLLNDLHSTDGIRLNNKEVSLNEDYLLLEEDVIYIGSFILLIEKIETAADLNGNAIAPFVPQTRMLRCVRVIDEAIEIKTFSFTLEPAIPFPYQPGQLLPLLIETKDRSISCLCPISSSPTRPLLEITLKQASNSDAYHNQIDLLSNWFFSHVIIGSELEGFSKPSGNFTCFPNPPKKILFVSAGIGIASIMSMLRWIYDTAADCEITLLHSTPTPDHIPFKQELELMAMRLPKFHLAITTTQQQGSSSWLGLTGRINLDLLATVVPDLQERTTYIAGSADFIQTLKQILKQLHFPMQNCYEEAFEVQSLIKQLHGDRSF